jgi:hypothetical protein
MNDNICLPFLLFRFRCTVCHLFNSRLLFAVMMAGPEPTSNLGIESFLGEHLFKHWTNTFITKLKRLSETRVKCKQKVRHLLLSYLFHTELSSIYFLSLILTGLTKNLSQIGFVKKVRRFRDRFWQES